ncbi:MAG: hypothetical protein ACK5OB_08535 [Pirellula sp.]
MILFVPALLIALVVLLWITWLAVGPTAVAMEPKRFLFDARKETADESPEYEGSPSKANHEYREHVQTRLDSPHPPLSSLVGGPGSSQSMLSHREACRMGDRSGLEC